MRYAKDLGTKSITGMAVDDLRDIAKSGKGKAVQLYSLFGQAVAWKEVVGKDDKISIKLCGKFQANYKKEKIRGLIVIYLATLQTLL